MSLTTMLLGLFGLGGSDDTMNGLEALQTYLAQQEAALSFEAVYKLPTIDARGEPTALFPYIVYDDGEQYSTGTKEFVVPDNGLADSDAPLTQFLAAYGIHSVEDLGDIQGQSGTARLTDSGDIEVEF